MEHAPGSAGDVRFLALLSNLDAVIAEVGLVATVKQVRHSLSSRLGLPEVALDGWSAEISALTDVAVRRLGVAREQQPPPGEVEDGPAQHEDGQVVVAAADAEEGQHVGDAEPAVPVLLDAQGSDPAAPAPPEEAQQAGPPQNDAGAPPRRRQYCGTWSHTDHAVRKSPESIEKAAFGELVVSTLNELFRKAAAPPKRMKMNHVVKLSVWQELHQNGKKHYHFPILADSPWYVEPLRRALQDQGIYTHFSADHDYYWTSVIYLAVPSGLPGGKTQADLDPEPWLSPGHPSVRDSLLDIPRGARPSDKGRVRRYLGESTDTARASSSVAFSDKEFSAFVLHRGMRSLTELLAWVRTQSEKRASLPPEQRAVLVGMEAYCYRNQADLKRRLSFAWEIADAPSKVAMKAKTAWEMVVAACEHDCVCEGSWVSRTEALLKWQCGGFPSNVPPQEQPESSVLRRALRTALQQGAQKHTNVFLYGPNTSGKSHVLKPLMDIFAGCVFLRPVGKGNYPLQDIFGAKVCVLQDVRVTTFKLSWDDMLVWFEGERFTVPFPRNMHGKDEEYSERAPIFISTGAKFSMPDIEAQRLRVNVADQNEMMGARFRFFHFPRSLAEHEKKVTPTCAACFARWLQEAPAPPSEPGTWL